MCANIPCIQRQQVSLTCPHGPFLTPDSIWRFDTEHCMGCVCFFFSQLAKPWCSGAFFSCTCRQGYRVNQPFIWEMITSHHYNEIRKGSGLDLQSPPVTWDTGWFLEYKTSCCFFFFGPKTDIFPKLQAFCSHLTSPCRCLPHATCHIILGFV